MTRLRHSNPPVDLSHILPTTKKRKKIKASKRKLAAKRRADSLDGRPILSREERLAAKERAEQCYLAQNPPRLIKGRTNMPRSK
jgi:hypothetical protein